MPQLDPTHFPSQLFWLAVTFIALYVVMARALLPRVTEVLQVRHDRIADDLDAAERFKVEAAAAKEAYESSLAEARATAQAMVKETTEAMAKESAERLRALDADMARRIADAEKSIAMAREKALASLTPASEALASLIVEKLVHHKPKPEMISAAVDKVAKSS